MPAQNITLTTDSLITTRNLSQYTDELAAHALTKRTEATAQSIIIADKISDIQNYIELVSADLSKANEKSIENKQIYDDNTKALDTAQNKKVEYQSTIQDLTDQLELKQQKIQELNKLNEELGTTSYGTDEILETISTMLDDVTKLFSDIEVFIPYKKKETDTSMENYMTSQVRSLELTTELSKKQAELLIQEDLYQKQLGIIELETKNQLKYMFKSRVEKISTLLDRDMTFEEGSDICDTIDAFIQELHPTITIY